MIDVPPVDRIHLRKGLVHRGAGVVVRKVDVVEVAPVEEHQATNGLRVVVGWASPEVGRTLAEAYSVAESRLDDALRREALQRGA